MSVRKLDEILDDLVKVRPGLADAIAGPVRHRDLAAIGSPVLPDRILQPAAPAAAGPDEPTTTTGGNDQ